MDKEQSLMRTLEVIFNRRSIRRYMPTPVPRELLQTILNAAIWSPSAHNRQPWRFVVIETVGCKEALAQEMGARLRRDLEKDNVSKDIIAQDTARSYARITTAPVVIVLCLTMVDMDVYADQKRTHNEYLMGVQSVAMAGQNLLLAAHELGLGACWMCAPLFCPDVVSRVLELPQDWQPQALITVGYPAETREKKRRELETTVVWR